MRFRRYPAGMPLASTCSAAISAACHRSLDDRDASVLPVQWGAMIHGEEGTEGRAKTGHCGFSRLLVDIPVSGKYYA